MCDLNPEKLAAILEKHSASDELIDDVAVLIHNAEIITRYRSYPFNVHFTGSDFRRYAGMTISTS